jgi:SAM-dependent methyltransferase
VPPDGRRAGDENLKLYGELAEWWPLLSPPDEYEEEAAIYARELKAAAARPVRSVLELGAGGGSNAFHMKAHFQLTLVDRAPGMLRHSRAINPQCEHVEGDMRTVRLGRTFDAVFVHDAVCYMTAEDDLRQAIETAFVHCAPGGAALFAPDYLVETFAPKTECGGHDDARRGLRYLGWVWDPDPRDSTYQVDYAYLLRDADGSVRVEHDRHVEGLFPRATWLRLMAEAGFRQVRAVPCDHSELDPASYELLIGAR